MIINRGLGTMYKTDSDGNVIDCDDPGNFLQSACWNPFASTVIPAAGGGTVKPAVPDGTAGFNTNTLLLMFGGLAVLMILPNILPRH